MGLPIAAVQVGIADRVATMEHPAVAHIDATMGNSRCVIGADKKHQITGPRAARPGADVIKALRPQPPKAPAALIVDVADEAGAVKGRGRAAAAPHIREAEIFFRYMFSLCNIAGMSGSDFDKVLRANGVEMSCSSRRLI